MCVSSSLPSPPLPLLFYSPPPPLHHLPPSYIPLTSFLPSHSCLLSSLSLPSLRSPPSLPSLLFLLTSYFHVPSPSSFCPVPYIPPPTSLPPSLPSLASFPPSFPSLPPSLPPSFPSLSLPPLILPLHVQYRCSELPAIPFPITCDELVPGLMPGVKLDIFFPGFPTLKHIPHTASLERKGVRVFQAASRDDNMCLTVQPRKIGDKVQYRTLVVRAPAQIVGLNPVHDSPFFVKWLTALLT